MRALVVENNPSTARLVERVLEDAGMVVVIAGTAEMAQLYARSNEFDVLILDVMLPDADGVYLCRTLRRSGVHTPVLMISVLGSVADRVRGLDAGADDYLVKPFDVAELAARVRALLRRRGSGGATVLRVADIEMNLLTRSVRRGERIITLTAKEFALLEYFMHNPDRVLTRMDIGTHVWDMNFDPCSNVIEVFVSALRRKLGEPNLIRTLIGTGYMLLSAPEEGRVPLGGRCRRADA
jgi:DNA-binding response OmpR family regulator